MYFLWISICFNERFSLMQQNLSDMFQKRSGISRKFGIPLNSPLELLKSCAVTEAVAKRVTFCFKQRRDTTFLS